MVEEEKEVKQPFKDTTFGKILLVIWEIIYYGMIYLTGISIIYGGYNEVEVPIVLDIKDKKRRAGLFDDEDFDK